MMQAATWGPSLWNNAAHALSPVRPLHYGMANSGMQFPHYSRTRLAQSRKAQAAQYADLMASVVRDLLFWQIRGEVPRT